MVAQLNVQSSALQVLLQGRQICAASNTEPLETFVGACMHPVPVLALLNCILGNQITEISGVSGLTQLTHLSLANNRIEQIGNLDDLPLKYLNLVR